MSTTTPAATAVTAGKALATEFAKSTAITAGVVVGFAVVGYTYQTVKDHRENRKLKKSQNEN